MKKGLKANLRPNASFDPEWYLSTYPDVASANINPLVHYVKHGLKEGRKPGPHAEGRDVVPPPNGSAHPSAPPSARTNGATAPSGKPAGLGDEAIRRAVGLQVDAAWYRARYADIKAARANPVGHFLAEGIDAGLAPNAFFDPDWYRSAYSDVASSGFPPIVHYVAYGSKEGRSAGPAFNAQAYLHARPELKTGGADPLPHFIKHDLGNAKVHLSMGHDLKRRGLRESAEIAYRRCLQLEPMRGALVGLRELAADVALEPADGDRRGGPGTLWIEIGDLLAVMHGHSVISGIQRVQFGLLSYVLSQKPDLRFVGWYEDALWDFQRESLDHLVRHYKKGAPDHEAQRRLIEDVLDTAVLVQPRAGDTFLATGVVYYNGDLLRARDRLRKTGVRIGLLVYDFIPLTCPEFCHPDLISQFAPAMSEALFQADFAIAISEYVAGEYRRLAHDSKYPTIPMKAVPLARCLEQEAFESQPDDWTPSIARLRDREFVLCVSTLNAHKNHMMLLNVWRLLMQGGAATPILVLAGKRAFGVDDLHSALNSSNFLDGHVMLIDGPNDMELATLYRHCLFTMCPSYVEGWGLPVGESLSRGKLSVASRSTSIPEVGGDLALYFDPYNIREAEGLVRRLLDDRTELQALESKVKAEFRPRSWDEYGRDLIDTATALAGGGDDGAEAKPGLRLLPDRLLTLRKAPDRWWFGPHLPPVDRINDTMLPRVVLTDGWRALEPRGVSMAGKAASLSLPMALPPGTPVWVVLRFRLARPDTRITVTADAEGGSPALWSSPLDGRDAFLVRVAGVVDAGSRVDIKLASTQNAALKLMAILYTARTPESDTLPAGRVVRPTGLIGRNGAVVSACSLEAIETSVARRRMLASGWAEPEAWGAWIAADEASIVFRVEPGDVATWKVVLHLRAAPLAHDTTVSIATGGTVKTVHFDAAKGTSLVVAVDCRPDAAHRVELQLKVEGLGCGRTHRVGLEGIIYGAADAEPQRARFADSLLSALEADEPEDDDAIVQAQLRFNVVGHVNGSYSLAEVNRQLALALESAAPGSTRLSQVEIGPTRDLSVIPPGQRSKIAELVDRAADADGLDITISQHWPVWEPVEPGDLPLAFTFWEESVTPRDMAATFNRGFAAVLAPSRFVAKALRDSGVRAPIHKVGFAPDLAGFLAIGARRAARTRSSSDAAAFTFLHVSSCFPRKGIDVLLRAYSEAFGAADPVKLIIKTFPSPHNDVEQQIARLRATNRDLAPIEVVNNELPTDAMYRLYEEADAMVLPTRGEGFNMPAAEALAAGLALIVTGFGAHLDYVSSSFVRLVDYAFAPSASHLKSAGSVWVDPDLNDLKVALLDVVRQSRMRNAADWRKRLAAGREAAVKLSDSAAWATRVRSATARTLTKRRAAKAGAVAWISSWNVRCGIAEYSRMLLDAYPGAAENVVVLCDERTEPLSASANGPRARAEWRVHDSESIDRLAAAVAFTNADAVVIQHHQGLIRWPDLTRLLQHPDVSSRAVIVQLHNVQEILGRDDPGHDALLSALNGVSRILVHTTNDMNILKSYGQIANVTLLPHGALALDMPPKAPRHLTPSSTPLIGAYGYMLPHKGFDKLIHALAILRSYWPNARLRMVTAEYPISLSGDAQRTCLDLARSLDLADAIEWHTSFLPTRQSLALLAETDLVVLPYQQTPESSSAAVRTALAAGAPVAVTPLSIFDDVNGAVLRLHGTDPELIANGLSWVLGRTDTRAELVREAAAWRAANGWDVVAQRLHGLIEGICLDRAQGVELV